MRMRRDGASWNEIARKVGVSRNTVRHHLKGKAMGKGMNWSRPRGSRIGGEAIDGSDAWKFLPRMGPRRAPPNKDELHKLAEEAIARGVPVKRLSKRPSAKRERADRIERIREHTISAQLAAQAPRPITLAPTPKAKTIP